MTVNGGIYPTPVDHEWQHGMTARTRTLVKTLIDEANKHGGTPFAYYNNMQALRAAMFAGILEIDTAWSVMMEHINWVPAGKDSTQDGR